MIKKTAPEMTVLVHEGRTSLKNLLEYIGDIPKRIIIEAVNQGIHPTGPQYWIYEGADENPETEFTLKICVPVATFGAPFKDGEFKLEKLPAYECLATEHKGDWKELGNTYNQLMGYMQQEQLASNGTCREVYINCDFEKPSNNITEVQMGLS